MQCSKADIYFFGGNLIVEINCWVNVIQFRSYVDDLSTSLFNNSNQENILSEADKREREQGNMK